MNLEIVYMDCIEYLSHHFPGIRFSKYISLRKSPLTNIKDNSIIVLYIFLNEFVERGLKDKSKRYLFEGIEDNTLNSGLII